MEHRFEYRQGDFAVCFVGDRDFVEAQIARFVPPDAAGQAAAASAGDDEPPPRIPSVQRNISARDFIALKEVTAPSDQVLALAYYVEKYEYRPSFAVEDLHDHLQALAIDPADATAALAEHCRQGLLIDEGEGRYSLSFSGEQRVKYGDFPAQGAGPD